MENTKLKKIVKHNTERSIISFEYIFFALLIGVIVGFVSIAFGLGLNYVTKLRTAHPMLILGLPLGGLIIVSLYKICKDENDTGTNLVLAAIHSKNSIPLRMAPLIFVSTIITHLFGGSAGREGAALQIGGSLGNYIARLFKQDNKSSIVLIMCGMSAAFSTLFGTPMAAAIFSMEVVSVGIMHYSALLPCVISSFVGHYISVKLGLAESLFPIAAFPALGIKNAIIVCILASLGAFVSILFVISLNEANALYSKYLKNKYLRAFVGGLIIVILTFVFQTYDYNGTGINVISKALDGNTHTFAFLFKILFTAITLGAGFKGGEIVPSFFIGASFGCLMGNIVGFDPELSASVGMISVFCGVTNCPITSLLISFEMFGFEGMPYYLLAVAFSYMCSGYFSLYKEQKIMYSKYHTTYINKDAD
ncbi:MAG: chloride channel protein [Lachnospiraceae bacterium]|nr:chloride channel protein [Lachnospiraceae bacterium]